MKHSKDIYLYFYINQAVYKSGCLVVSYEEALSIVKRYFNKNISFTPAEFIDALSEDLCDQELHLLLGGRKSKNPVMIMYGNHNTKKRTRKNAKTFKHIRNSL